MKTIKIIDLYLQLIAVLLGILACIFFGSIIGIAYIYILLGIIQPISFIFHFPSGKWDSKPRRLYGFGLLLFILLFIPHLMHSSYASFFPLVQAVIATILAIFYIRISYKETYIKAKKI
jgi:hypothetical protein